jgi:hypothetical protein
LPLTALFQVRLEGHSLSREINCDELLFVPTVAF